MNTSNLKSYAPKARKDFIAAVTARANLLGLSEADGQLVVAEAKISGDLAMIAGRPWPVKVNEQRNKLVARMRQQGFGHTVEAVAYAWFNRLAALRFMELHDYLGHGRRVLSNPQGGLPEVLAHALDLVESDALPGMSIATVRRLKLSNQDPELYRLILIAQCNALHQAMPFLFEQLGDETELLLPENLLLTDSVVAKLVESIPEEDWQQIEIIGWLYQFYISEKKEQVIGKVVKPEDIPAATQLFTPNWIVKYMVQNSLGAQWLAAYPGSPIKAKMEYYIEPAEQTEQVGAQLAAITPSSLNPEELTLMDPASGSGHILVEAYDLFKAIYLERGYRQRDVAKLILEKNLFGLDIDERAAQLTGFALMMKGRADDRRLFERGVKLNVMPLVDSAEFDAKSVEAGIPLSDYGLVPRDLAELKQLFENSTTFGSLIRVPSRLAAKLSELKQLGGTVCTDIFVSEELARLGSLVKQAELLAKRYDTVVANPPYMGSGFMPPTLKAFVEETYPLEKGDLFSCFIRRGEIATTQAGMFAFVTMQSWMFLTSYEAFRRQLLSSSSISNLLHLGNGVMGIAFGTCATVFRRSFFAEYIAKYFQIAAGDVGDKGSACLSRATPALRSINDFRLSPAFALAYALTERQMALFKTQDPISEKVEAREGMTTADNVRFLRYWWEVDGKNINRSATRQRDSVGASARWFPYQKGGEAKKWFGNNEWVVDWKNDGEGVKGNIDPKTRRVRSHNYNGSYSFREGITWSSFSNGALAFRYVPAGYLFDSTGSMAFAPSGLHGYLAILNSLAGFSFLKAYSPSPRIKIESLLALPDVLRLTGFSTISELAKDSVDAAMEIDRLSEVSPAFRVSEADLRRPESVNNLLVAASSRLARNEPKIEALVSAALGFEGDELVPQDSPQQIFRGRDLTSYAVGCMMGRYSLDTPGLIYADRGNSGFDVSHYAKFPADADGIVPVTDELWFEDDAALRIREFLLALWGVESLEKNMAWLAANLGCKASETPEEAIRRYLAGKFFRDHLQTYKKRPIYWLFSSGRQGAFQALVYLHRYNGGTLSRLRAEYVIPLTGKMQGRIEQLERDVTTANSTAARNHANKQLENLRKKHLELLAYDEQLRHYADQRIELDLDDGVKVNYGKFGDLLAEVKTVVGKQDEE